MQWQRVGLLRMLHSGEVLVSVLVLAALPFLLVGQGGYISSAAVGRLAGLERLGSFGSAGVPALPSQMMPTTFLVAAAPC